MTGTADESQPVNETYPLEEPTLSSVVSLVIAEYQMLREEIGRYHDHQKQVMNFAFLLLAAMFGLVGASIESKPSDTFSDISLIFLGFPIIYALLALLYCDRTVRIVRLADYLHNYLRRKADLITGSHVWQWEIYKRQTELFDRRLALWLDKARWTVFILPSVVSFGLHLAIDASPDPLGERLLFLAAVLATATATVMAFLVEETTGIRPQEPVDLDAYLA